LSKGRKKESGSEPLDSSAGPGNRLENREGANSKGCPLQRSNSPRSNQEARVNYLPDLAGTETGDEVVPCRTECGPEERTYNTVRLIEVTMKMTADQVVSRVSTLAAARGPNAVCEPCPPKAPARSAERPCCSKTTPIRNRHTST
jgi:hypothetical protein